MGGMAPISVSNLPPHEPVTQMISPAAPPSTHPPGSAQLKAEHSADTPAGEKYSDEPSSTGGGKISPKSEQTGADGANLGPGQSGQSAGPTTDRPIVVRASRPLSKALLSSASFPRLQLTKHLQRLDPTWLAVESNEHFDASLLYAKTEAHFHRSIDYLDSCSVSPSRQTLKRKLDNTIETHATPLTAVLQDCISLDGADKV